MEGHVTQKVLDVFRFLSFPYECGFLIVHKFAPFFHKSCKIKPLFSKILEFLFKKIRLKCVLSYEAFLVMTECISK